MIESSLCLAVDEFNPMADLGEDLQGQVTICLDTFINCHTQPSEHQGDKSTRRRPTDKVEIIAWSGRILGIDRFHELLQQEEAGNATNPPTI